MKRLLPKRCNAGFTVIDILCVIAVLLILSALIFSGGAGSKRRATRITCVNNLKQIGLSFRIYAGDSRDRYPMNISTNEEPVANEATPVYQYFKLLSNELGTPKVLICPADKKRKAAIDFTNFNNSNVSYFIGLDANEKLPQTILAGDRNITNGLSPKHGILELTTNQPIGFTDEMHMKQGNVAMGDGSVQQVPIARLRLEIIRNTGFATNRILLP